MGDAEKAKGEDSALFQFYIMRTLPFSSKSRENDSTRSPSVPNEIKCNQYSIIVRLKSKGLDLIITNSALILIRGSSKQPVTCSQNPTKVNNIIYLHRCFKTSLRDAAMSVTVGHVE